MFCYQPNFFSQTEVVTPELFARLTVSDAVVNRIKEYRAKLPELDRLKAEIKSGEWRVESVECRVESVEFATAPQELKAEIKRLKAECRKITSIKSGLPVMMYQATFDETTSKNGYKGRWRKQSAARLNGLFILDIDHVEDPKAEVMRWVDRLTSEHVEDYSQYVTFNEQLSHFCEDYGIYLIHVTPSGRGLRIVGKAETSIGNIADNQRWLSNVLGVEPDEACKDASRASFCPTFEDILYINKEKLFTYENKEFDEKYGDLYRGGDSRPRTSNSHAAAQPRVAGDSDTGLRPVSAEGAAGNAPRVGSVQDNQADDVDGRLKAGYHGKSYREIADRWFQQNGGKPKTGDRHQSLYRLACDLRYITDFDPQLLARVLAESEVGAEVVTERGQSELDRIAGDACALQRYRTIPRRLQTVLQSVGVQLAEGDGKRKAQAEAPIDYGAWWARLKPLLEESPVLREAVVTLPDHLKLAGVLAAGAMLGSYLTRTWWEHFDGKDYRLSFLVYIIGDAASGKSFVVDMDRLIMAPMLSSDRVGREWERQYKEEMKKRSASSKNAKAEAPEQQHPCIRYVPSTISNAMLYRRLTDAIDTNATTPDGQQPLHLHIYTMEPELATALRAQQGSWAGKNDLELKSFHNEFAGVDYANDQSVNGIIQVNWNQVVTGTPESMNRKIKPSMVLDGLVTRLVLFPMPSNDFQMIERRTAVRDHEREAMLRSVGIKLEEVCGELKAGRLVDFCYDYERKLCKEAKLEEDFCLDYFRKRIPVIMMRYTLVRMVLRMLQSHTELEVLDSDLDFARLIGDWCLMAQMHMFGDMVMQARERENSNFVPRRRSTKVRETYALLPEKITTATLIEANVAKNLNYANEIIRRWLEDGLIEKTGNKQFKKKYDVIPE